MQKKSPTSAANASDETGSFTSETTEPELFSDNVTPKGGVVKRGTKDETAAERSGLTG
ncbi:MAG: hypothetical protein RSB97_03230 [Christensenella sp.]